MMLNEYIKREDVLLLAREYYTPALRESAVPVKAIKNIPAEDVAPVKRGKWIHDDLDLFKCSVCGEFSCCRGNYCPDCGAEMDGKDINVATNEDYET